MRLLSRMWRYVRTDAGMRRRGGTTSPETRSAMAELDEVDATVRPVSTGTGPAPATDDGPDLDDIRRMTDR